MTHSDRDGSEPLRRELHTYLAADTVDLAPWERALLTTAAPAGLPLHESADRDADNVPSDRVPMVPLWQLEIWKACAKGQETRADEAEDAIARVQALHREWERKSLTGGAEDRWRAQAASELNAALRGPEPTEATSNEDAPGLDVGADAPTSVGAEQTEECIDDSDICGRCDRRHAAQECSEQSAAEWTAAHLSNPEPTDAP